MFVTALPASRAEDKHVCCEACLGLEHALLALSSPGFCPLCARLSPEERQQRADAAAVLAEEDDFYDAYTVEEALNCFDLAGGPESDDFASSLHAYRAGLPVPLSRLLALAGLWTAVRASPSLLLALDSCWMNCSAEKPVPPASTGRRPR